MICPKCGSEMRSYERNGVTIDQCTGCRGIFLDRGELERLVDAEGAYYAAQPGRDRERSSRGHDDHDRSYSDRDDHDRSRGYQGHGSGQKRKKSFLDELFD